ncbi:MAG: kynureninase, partial [Alphaproteobacteria bacterium]
PRSAPARVARAMAEWREQLIGGWNRAGWMEMPERLGARIAALIGAPPDSVVVGETLTIRIFQLLGAALALRPGRKVVLSDSGNFPSDLYAAQALIEGLGQGHELRVVAPEAVEAAIAEAGEALAVLMLTEVDYRTGRRHDMARLTARAHEVGALTLWDLAHSAGAIRVDLTAAGADFAAGCTYKFLNGGPGAPAFAYLRPDLAGRAAPLLVGWLGHAEPFAFAPDWRPASGAAGLRIGTPPVLQMAALEAALEIWDGIDLAALEARAGALGDRLIAAVRARCPELALASPARAAERGAQVSFRHPEGYAVMQALIARGVVGDFRAPDIIRFGITPLYVGEAEIDRAADTLAEVLATRAWDRPEYRRRQRVT